MKSHLPRALIVAGTLVSAFSVASLLSRNDTANAAPDADSQKFASQVSHLFQNVTSKALPSVVSISTVKSFDPRRMEALRALEPELETDPGRGELPKAVGMGSGVVIRGDGMILTNNHVVEGAEHVMVSLDEKHKARATVVGTDPKTDLAVIRLEPPANSPGPVSPYSNLPVLEFGNSDELKVGDLAIAIGSPYGLSKSVSFGIISAKGRAQMGVLETEDFIQTDAAINPGSSGGPLLNTKGEVIGISTAIFSQSGGFAGIGFAIPSRIAGEIGEQLIKNGTVTRGWMGLTAQDLNEDLAEYFKIDGKSDKGALISHVDPASPAKKEIQPGDVVLQVNQKQIEDAAHLKALVSHASSGQKLAFQIRRDGKPLSMDLKVTKDPKQAAPPRTQLAGRLPKSPEAGKKPALGVIVENIPSEILELFEGQVASGVIIVGVKPGTPAFDAGLFTGDIILKVNQKQVTNTQEFAKAVKSLQTDSLTVLYVQRGPDETIFVPLRT